MINKCKQLKGKPHPLSNDQAGLDRLQSRGWGPCLARTYSSTLFQNNTKIYLRIMESLILIRHRNIYYMSEFTSAIPSTPWPSG